MSAELKSDAAWRGFFLAVICVGIGTLVGMLAGFLVGSLADAVILASTGDDRWRYGFILAETGTYIGIFLGIAAGIASGASAAMGAIKKMF